MVFISVAYRIMQNRAIEAPHRYAHHEQFSCNTLLFCTLKQKSRRETSYEMLSHARDIVRYNADKLDYTLRLNF